MSIKISLGSRIFGSQKSHQYESPRNVSESSENEQLVDDVAIKSLQDRPLKRDPQPTRSISFSLGLKFSRSTNPYREDFNELIQSSKIEKTKINEQIIINYLSHKKITEVQDIIALGRWEVIYEFLKILPYEDMKKTAAILLRKMKPKLITEFIKYLIDREIVHEKESTLFRQSYNLTSAIISSWYVQILVPKFRTTFKDIIKLIPKGKFVFDVNKAKNQEEVDAAVIKTKNVFTKILEKMIKIVTSKKIPNEIREINSYTRRAIITHFNKKLANSFKGQWFILRFFNPILINPSEYVFRHYYSNTDNGAIMLSKLMQALANNVKFGEKEPHMAPFNDFLFKANDNQKSFKKKFDKAIQCLYETETETETESESELETASILLKDSNSASDSSEFVTDVEGMEEAECEGYEGDTEEIKN